MRPVTKPRRHIALLAAVTAMAALGLSVTAQGLSTNATIGGSKDKSGPFVPTGHVKIDVGESRDLYFRVKSISDQSQDHELVSFTTKRPAYKVTWFKGKHDITDDVNGVNGYEFSLGAHRKKLIRVHVKRRAGHDATCVAPNLFDGSNTFEASSEFSVDSKTACT